MKKYKNLRCTSGDQAQLSTLTGCFASFLFPPDRRAVVAQHGGHNRRTRQRQHRLRRAAANSTPRTSFPSNIRGSQMHTCSAWTRQHRVCATILAVHYLIAAERELRHPGDHAVWSAERQVDLRAADRQRRPESEVHDRRADPATHRSRRRRLSDRAAAVFLTIDPRCSAPSIRTSTF